MRQKNAFLFRKQFLSATEDLKDRFKIIVGKFLRKRAEKQFEDMKNMILNFDKEDKKAGKSKQKTMMVNQLNLDLIEEEDDLEESITFDKIAVFAPVSEKPIAKAEASVKSPKILSEKQAVQIIQSFFLGRCYLIKSREMWADLHSSKYKGLPSEVKRNFIKMWIAK